MARYDEPTQSQIPDDGTGDLAGWRHFGDGIAGRIDAARMQGYSAGDLAYRDIAVDSSGQLQFSLATGDIEIGAVELKDGTSDQRATITGSGALKVDGSAVTQPVSGSVAVSNLPAVQPVNDNGGSLTVDGAVSVSNLPAVQPVSDNGGLLSVDDGGGSLTVDGSVSVSNFPGTQPVSGPLTDAQLRATPVPVSGTVTASGPLTDTQLRASPVAISTASLPLPAGAATEATLAAVNGKLPTTLGQKTKAGSLAIVLASDSDALPVTGTFFQATQPVSGAVSVSNFPATQPVSAVDLDIRNLDASQDNVLAKIDPANNDVDVLTEPATALSSGGALPTMVKLLGALDHNSGLVRPIGSENFRGEYRLTVFDHKVFKALNETLLMLTEIRDLLAEQGAH